MNKIKIQKGNDAEALLKHKSFNLLEDKIKQTIDKNHLVMDRGLTENQYWKMVGANEALSSIIPYLNRLIQKRDAIIKRDAPQDNQE